MSILNASIPLGKGSSLSYRWHEGDSASSSSTQVYETGTSHEEPGPGGPASLPTVPTVPIFHVDSNYVPFNDGKPYTGSQKRGPVEAIQQMLVADLLVDARPRMRWIVSATPTALHLALSTGRYDAEPRPSECFMDLFTRMHSVSAVRCLGNPNVRQQELGWDAPPSIVEVYDVHSTFHDFIHHRLSENSAVRNPVTSLASYERATQYRRAHLIKLKRLYSQVAEGQSDAAISYFFEACAQRSDSLLADADVDKLDASVLVAILLGTRVRKAGLPSRADFSLRARKRLLELLPAERVEKLWERIA